MIFVTGILFVVLIVQTLKTKLFVQWAVGISRKNTQSYNMSRDETWLLRLNGLFFLTASLAGIFVNLFLFQLGGFKSVIYFGLVSLFSLYIVYLSSSYYLRKISSKVSIRASFLIYAFFYTLLFLLRENSVHYLFLLGLINGFAGGLYWVGNNITQYIATQSHTRHEFFGKLNFFMNVGNSFGPSVGGLIIYVFGQFYLKSFGYFVLFSLVSFLFLILFFVTNKLPGYKVYESSIMHIFKHKRIFSWKIVLSQQFLYGLFDVAFGTLSPILIFLFLKQEFSVGLVNTITVLCYAFANLIAIKILKKYSLAYILGSFGMGFGLFIFGLEQNWIGILSLILFANTFAPLLNIVASKSVYDVMDSVKEPWQRKYHFLVERDTALGIARVLVYSLLLLLFTSGNQVLIAKNWVLIISVIPLLIGSLQLYKDIRIKN